MRKAPSTKNLSTAQQGIGPRLRRLRKKAGLSVRTLAQQLGLSASFLSQVENSLVSPSIGSLEKIALKLRVTLSDLFATPNVTNMSLVRRRARPSFTSGWSKARVEALTPSDSGGTLEALMVILAGGGTSGKHPSVAGVDQFAIVMKGRPTLTHGDQDVQLAEGDAILIRAHTPRRWQNLTSYTAQVLIVSSRSH
jgi:transcriptional regulator with XRE-family HTH domain